MAGARFWSPADAVAEDVAFAKFAEDFLREASTGIVGLDVQTRDVTKSELREIWRSGEEVAILHTPNAQGPRSHDDSVLILKIMASHELPQGQRAIFPLQEESDGSQRLLNLLPALHRLTRQGGVFVIDELERSMHPMLARKFIEFFLKVAGNRESQLIFATHESTLLDQIAPPRRSLVCGKRQPGRHATLLPGRFQGPKGPTT